MEIREIKKEEINKNNNGIKNTYCINPIGENLTVGTERVLKRCEFTRCHNEVAMDSVCTIKQTDNEISITTTEPNDIIVTIKLNPGSQVCVSNPEKITIKNSCLFGNSEMVIEKEKPEDAVNDWEF